MLAGLKQRQVDEPSKPRILLSQRLQVALLGLLKRPLLSPFTLFREAATLAAGFFITVETTEALAQEMTGFRNVRRWSSHNASACRICGRYLA